MNVLLSRLKWRCWINNLHLFRSAQQFHAYIGSTSLSWIFKKNCGSRCVLWAVILGFLYWFYQTITDYLLTQKLKRCSFSMWKSGDCNLSECRKCVLTLVCFRIWGHAILCSSVDSTPLPACTCVCTHPLRLFVHVLFWAKWTLSPVCLTQVI